MSKPNLRERTQEFPYAYPLNSISFYVTVYHFSDFKQAPLMQVQAECKNEMSKCRMSSVSSNDGADVVIVK
jgi:hypothetical protein